MFSSQSQWQARFLLTPRNGLKAFRKSFCNSTFFIFLLLAQTLLKFAQVPNVQFGAHLGSVCPRSPIWLFLAVILFPHSPLDPRIQRSSFNHNRHTYSARGFFLGGRGGKWPFAATITVAIIVLVLGAIRPRGASARILFPAHELSFVL